MTTIQGLDALQRKLKTLENFQRKLKTPMNKSVKLVHKYWGAKPRKKKGAFSAMATPGQRRAYWARVGSGDIEHGKFGYKRTNQIVNSLETRVNMHSNGVKGVVGTNAPGARYVIGSKQQQPFHKASGWRTNEEVIEAKLDEINALFDKVVKRELNR